MKRGGRVRILNWSRIAPPPGGQIFVGTHALLYEPDGLENPGLVVIDEQHKFGVAQRGRLTTREPAPDVLVMTATPIPRTLTMSLYGDLDVSTIDEMPADRGRIVTAARDRGKIAGRARIFAPRTGSGTAGLCRLSVDRRERKTRGESGFRGV